MTTTENKFLGNPMITDDAIVSIDSLCEEFGKSARTISNWVKRGLLPRPLNSETRCKKFWRVGQLRAHNRLKQRSAEQAVRILEKKRAQFLEE